MSDTTPDVVELPNGALADKKSGKIVKASQKNLWDSKKASEMAKLRHSKMKEKTAEAITEAVQEKGLGAVEDFPDAHKEITKLIMKDVVLDSSGATKGGDRMKTYESLLSMEGSMGNVRRQEQGEGAGLTITFSPEIAKSLIEGAMAWKLKQAGAVVDSEFKVVDNDE
jgi:hypothetical protein